MLRPRLLPRTLVVGLTLMAAILVVGVIGFMVEGLDLIDALFTTVSAVTTVGYAPSQPLSPAGKLFATFLILGGVATGIYVLGSLTEFLVEGGLHGSWQRRKVSKAVERLSNHFIICGFGRVGRQVATQLEASGAPFVVVDHNPDSVAVARERQLMYIEGDITLDSVLEAAGVERARGLLACADSDVNNVYVTLSARSLNPNLDIVARATNADAERKLYNAGATRVVSPYTMAGNRMAHLAVQPLAADYVDLVVHGGTFGVQFEERTVGPDSALAGRTIGDIRRRELKGAHILAVEHDGELKTLVEDDALIASGDRILVAGTADQLAVLDGLLER